MRKSQRRGEVTLVQILMTLVVIGILIVLLLPVIIAVQEHAERSRKREAELITAIKDWRLFPEIFYEGSRWRVSDKTKDGSKILVYTDETTGEETLRAVKEDEDSKGRRIVLNGEMWPDTTPVGEAFKASTPTTPTESAKKAEKE